METKLRKPFDITNYELEGDTITADVLSADGAATAHITIARADFEHWLTNGTGEVTYFVPVMHGEEYIADRMARYPVADFWMEHSGVIRTEIYSYLCRTESEKLMVADELCRAKIATLLESSGVTPTHPGWYPIMQTLIEYGQVNRAWYKEMSNEVKRAA